MQWDLATSESPTNSIPPGSVHRLTVTSILAGAEPAKAPYKGPGGMDMTPVIPCAWYADIFSTMIGEGVAGSFDQGDAATVSTRWLTA